jgi:hypothetical protein
MIAALSSAWKPYGGGEVIWLGAERPPYSEAPAYVGMGTWN